ncbi:MAG: PcfK-like family protein [Christensenellaceae bacterium]|jgi:predicted type IV restriction endonuclease|nr:PcfK-like family protein [Christensenellaceae bacterium]
MNLNLSAVKAEEIIIKDYLENNASEVLAEKINNGVKIVKDGKTLINKKTLATFMSYACEEARKQAEKGARFAVVSDGDVFMWAVHYFEEDSIEGSLYNEDGSEYKPVVATKPKVETPKPKIEVPAAPKTISIFDMMEERKVEDFKPVDDGTEPQQTAVPQFLFDLFGDDLKVEVD